MIYLFLYLANIVTTLKVVSFCLALVLVFAFGMYMDCEREFNKTAKTLLITAIISGILGVFTPTDRCLYQMGAVYVGKEIATNKQVSETLNKVNTVINMHLDKQIKNLSETEASK